MVDRIHEERTPAAEPAGAWKDLDLRNLCRMLRCRANLLHIECNSWDLFWLKGCQIRKALL